jgi:hypothetical protein
VDEVALIGVAHGELHLGPLLFSTHGATILGCWSGASLKEPDPAVAPGDPSILDGSFTDVPHHWGMSLPYHFPRLPKTCLIRAAAGSAAILIAIASLSPQSPAIETSVGAERGGYDFNSLAGGRLRTCCE